MSALKRFMTYFYQISDHHEACRSHLFSIGCIGEWHDSLSIGKRMANSICIFIGCQISRAKRDRKLL